MASIYDKASLVLIPSGTKTSKVYSQVPVSGDGDFTFSRSTMATRVNADGNIEKETQNLLVQSNSFNTTWVNSNSTETGGQSGYDGSSDAWQLTASSAGFAYLQQSNTQSGVQTFSVYAKAGTADHLQVYITGTDSSHYFDLTNGTASTPTGAGAIDSSIEDIGSGWYRCSCVCNGTNATLRLYIRQGVNVNPSAGEFIYIQDAQLEQGLVARSYNETTTSAFEGGITDNVPRLDYTDSSCPALLLEPQRTNLVSQSEFYGGSDWGRTRCGFVTNTSETLSPEGLYNASKMTSTAIQESYAQNDVVLGSTSGTYTFFAKKGDLDYCHALVWDRGASGRRQWFNLATGEVGTTTNFGSGYTKVDATIEDYGNGWYRCSFSWSGGNTTSGVRINISSGDGVIGSPINSYGYFYGAQVEAGVSYATSYIPTYGTSVTRSYDYLPIKSGMQNFLGTDTGTWFFHINDMFFDITGTGVGSFILTYTGTQLIEVIQDGNNQYKITLNNSVAVQDLDGEDKVAISWSSAGLVIYVNGSSVYTTTSTAYSNAYSSLQINKTTRPARVDLKQMMLFPTRLTNAELADLTTI